MKTKYCKNERYHGDGGGGGGSGGDGIRTGERHGGEEDRCEWIKVED